MKILFFGCQKVAIDILRDILDSPHEIVGVVTHDEDRDLLYSDELVQDFCFKNRLPSIRIPDNKKVSDYMSLFESLQPDIIFSIYYRRLLPASLVNLPQLGSVNLHPSLLPLDRGPNPTYWVVRRGDAVTGTTLHYLDEGMDTGDIIAQKSISVLNMNGYQLNKSLMQHGARLFKEQFPLIMVGANDRKPQNNAIATCNVKFKNNMRYIDWCQPAENVIGHIRAHANPYPGSIAVTNRGSKILLHDAEIYGSERSSGGPGSVCVKEIRGDKGLVIQTQTKPIFVSSEHLGFMDNDYAPDLYNPRINTRFISGVPE